MEIACHSQLVVTPRWIPRLDDQKSTEFTYVEKASDRLKSKINVQRSGRHNKHHKSFHWNFYNLSARVKDIGGVSYGNTNFEYVVWASLLQKRFAVRQLEDLEFYKTFEIWLGLARISGFNRKVEGVRNDKRWENMLVNIQKEVNKKKKLQ